MNANKKNRRIGRPTALASLSLTYRRVAHFLYRLAFTIAVSIIGYGSLPSVAVSEEQMRLGLPVNCKMGLDCFVQQMPDIDPGQATLDPLCGQATYQGHTGWDIRLRTLSDIARDVPVISVADGTVSRIRDGIPDQIFDAANDRHDLHDMACGNGIIIDHQGGLSSQYCHLKTGSLAVRSGMFVRKGERIGSIGSSGVAEFPHVHLSVRQDGKLVEPLTGKALRSESPVCGDLSGSLFDAASKRALVQAPVTILDVGLANAPPELGNLVRSGGPPLATGGGNSTIAWVWAINVDQGSRFRIKLVGPGETTLIDHATTELPRRKANYLAYVGRKAGVKAGTYLLSVEITDGEKRITSNIRSFTVSE
ncbi:M23 family metallopeptidase [Bradyrhizobium sp. AUGA SZCCT0176]|uniref:M23 family metallopeptidase n=1 Tax=Bradyrhizobium sp. AUGA SZCCT0176 TaxID=2807664 RepID=UPI001BA6A6F5|nr:M23 family metallopeptidase [Bradyrhizobium sp. AUGA SZCCT0176]MBR1224209.1 M23 family metallopeptidase [Bradyrhizobium sp. AUGA SZCCT0176]